MLPGLDKGMTGSSNRRVLGLDAHARPYRALGDGCEVARAEVDDSIVMDDTVIDVERKIVQSMIGKGSKIMSANGLLPKGERLVVGENTTIYI
jgi:glucose-1-phosphate thymidylyltransferase